MKGVILRSRARWYELGEKSTNYFCNLENRNFTNKIMHKLELDNGTVTNEPTEILEKTREFYSSLYQETETTHENLLEERLSACDYNKISEEEQSLIPGPISYTELSNVFKRMKNDKSPGFSGYTVEFFKFFWGDIGKLIHKSILYAFENNNLSSALREGIITCLPKPGKSRCKLKNWRPITLLNVRYKMISACIAERIKTLLPKLINEDQKGFISGRFIGENIRTIFDIILETKKLNIAGLIMLLDFEKAFDTVSWKFIEYVFNLFNFGPTIIKWIKLLYNDSTSKIIQNGYLSNSVIIKRGCRQGDPISPYIFLLCAEILGILIRGNKNIKGIKLFDIEFKLSQYADDTSQFLDGSEQSLRETLSTLDLFHKVSGLRMNEEKTKLIWIGSMTGSEVRLCPEKNLGWVNEQFTALGVKFSVYTQDMEELNFRPKLQEMKATLKMWRMRNLTLYGKITVIKSLVLSKINHLLSSLPTPSNQIMKEIENLLFSFLWNNKKDKIKRSQVQKPVSEGGLNMINIYKFTKSLKVSWIKRYHLNVAKWKIFLDKYMDTINIFDIGYDFFNVLSTQIDNPFWKDVILAWEEFTNKTYNNSINPIDLLSQPIWYNKTTNTDFFIENWYNHGLKYLGDLYNENGILIKDFNTIKQMFNLKGTFLEYRHLLYRLPRALKSINQSDVLNYNKHRPHIPTTLNTAIEK